MGTLYCLDVGFGDASVIVTPGATFLIDCNNIGLYSRLLPQNKRLAGVLITHQHEDHFSGLAYLWEHGYTIEYLIYSPYERRRDDQSVSLEDWNEFESHKRHFQQRGTQLRAPYRELKHSYWKTSAVSFWIIGPFPEIAQAETRELHDACLVITVQMGQSKCVFTGDASDASLNRIAGETTHFCDGILHASHHGSLNGADLDFIQKANPADTIISTKEGVYDSVPHPTAVRRYRDHTRNRVHRTDHSGSTEYSF